MSPILFSWDTRKGSVSLKRNGFFSLGWERGKVLAKIFGILLPYSFNKRKTHIPIRWFYLKKAFSFLKEWKLEKMEGTLSFQDPMINGLLYGWICTMGKGKNIGKVNLSINFLGENGCSVEASVSSKIFFHHLKEWMFPLFREMRRREKSRRGGE